MANFTYHIEVIGTDSEYHEIPVSITYNATYQRAYVSGPPEDCYPAEGEMEIESMDFTVCEGGPTRADVEDALAQHADAIDEKAWEDFHNNSSDDYEF